MQSHVKCHFWVTLSRRTCQVMVITLIICVWIVETMVSEFLIALLPLGKRIPAEEFSRFQPVFSPLSSSHRSANASYPIAKQGCLFPFNSAHTASAANHLHNTQNNMFNSLTNECLTSSPPFKRKMLNNSGDSEMTASTQNESSIQSTCKISNIISILN